MVNYLLVENREIIHLNMPWRQRFFQSELDDLRVNFTVPVNEQYCKINDNFELIPVTKVNQPPHDPLFEHLIGPFFIFYDTFAESGYTKEFNDLDSIKTELKARIAAERYKRENAGTSASIQSANVWIDTSREIRNIFIQKLLMMGDNETSNWKFNEIWLSITKQELQLIIQTGSQYIQSQFDWEKELGIKIDSASTVSELQSINEEIFPVVKTGLGPQNAV